MSSEDGQRRGYGRNARETADTRARLTRELKTLRRRPGEIAREARGSGAIVLQVTLGVAVLLSLIVAISVVARRR